MPSCEEKRLIVESEVRMNEAMKDYLTQQIGQLKLDVGNFTSM